MFTGNGGVSNSYVRGENRLGGNGSYVPTAKKMSPRYTTGLLMESNKSSEKKPRSKYTAVKSSIDKSRR